MTKPKCVEFSKNNSRQEFPSSAVGHQRAESGDAFIVKQLQTLVKINIVSSDLKYNYYTPEIKTHSYWLFNNSETHRGQLIFWHVGQPV